MFESEFPIGSSGESAIKPGDPRVRHLQGETHLRSILEFTAIPAETGLGPKLDIFARYILLHLTTRELVRVIEEFDSMRLAWMIIFAVSLLLTIRGYQRAGAGLALAGLTLKLHWLFPSNSNHFALEYLSVLILCFFDGCVHGINLRRL